MNKQLKKGLKELFSGSEITSACTGMHFFLFAFKLQSPLYSLEQQHKFVKKGSSNLNKKLNKGKQRVFFVCFLLTADRVLLWTLKFVNVITQERSDVGVSNATGA